MALHMYCGRCFWELIALSNKKLTTWNYSDHQDNNSEIQARTCDILNLRGLRKREQNRKSKQEIPWVHFSCLLFPYGWLG